MTPLPVGSAAPDFELRDQHGSPVRLADHRGSRVLLVFYPWAFSRVCGGELRDLRDHWEPRDDVVVLALSCDPVFSLRAYADAERLTVPLLSDFWPHGAVATAYGVLDEERGCSTRSTFLVDADGTVVWSVHNPGGEPRRLEDYRSALEGASSTK